MIEIIDLPVGYAHDVFINWLNVCADELSVRIKRITYHIVNDERILQVNRDFLKHDYYTDIITFDYGTEKRLEGDVYVSMDTVVSNAYKHKADVNDEFMRVLVHGMLHLAGFEDQCVEKQRVMRKKEDYCLSLRTKN